MKKSRLAQRKLGIKPKPKQKSKSLLKFFLFLVLLILVSLAVFYIFSPKTWDGKSKITVSVQRSSGEVNIIILDPPSSSIYSIVIPPQTQVEASNQLGSWKLESITKLGIDKKLGGDFLKNTIIKSFNFPVDYWAEENFLSNLNSKPSNLTLIDKIRIMLFSFGVGNSSKVDINLKDTSVLARSQLVDTSLGWKITNNMPSKIKSYFVIANPNEQVLIRDTTQDVSSANMVAKAIAFLGINVASVQVENDIDFDCVIIGKDKEMVSKIANIFDCTSEIKKPANNFDVQIDLGTKFKNRF